MIFHRFKTNFKVWTEAAKDATLTARLLHEAAVFGISKWISSKEKLKTGCKLIK